MKPTPRSYILDFRNIFRCEHVLKNPRFWTKENKEHFVRNPSSSNFRPLSPPFVWFPHLFLLWFFPWFLSPFGFLEQKPTANVVGFLGGTSFGHKPRRGDFKNQGEGGKMGKKPSEGCKNVRFREGVDIFFRKNDGDRLIDLFFCKNYMFFWESS